MMKTVDNSGAGNCMYYAYSISLMYFLLRKRNPETAEKLFTRLELNLAQKKRLNALLEDPELTEFSTNQIKQIIEPILGKATRQIGSFQVKAQFLKNPLDTSLLHATNHGMIYLFRLELENKKSPLAHFLAHCKFDIPNYTEAEIYKAFKINQSEFHRHIKKHYKSILKNFGNRWPERVNQIYQEKLNELKRSISTNYDYQMQFIQELLGSKSLKFSELIDKFEVEWNRFTQKIHNDCYQILSQDDIKANPRIQYEFLKNLMPKNKITFREAALRFPGEWAAHIDELFKQNLFTKEELRNNDIYRQQFRKEIEEKVSLKFIDVISQHEDAWLERVNTLFEANKDTVTQKALSEDVFHAGSFLTDLIQEKTVDFFTANNNKNLDIYQEHLNTDCVWGSEETLLLLHSYLQGERTYRDENDEIQREYDTDILLEIYENGSPKSGSKTQRPDMILDNHNNIHWVSLVEPIQKTHSPKKAKQQDKDKPSESTALDVIDTPNIISKEEKMDLLNRSNFIYYLKELKLKANNLKKRGHSVESRQANHIYQNLSILKNDFLDEDPSMSPKEFAEKAEEILKNARVTDIEKHRGIGKILNDLMNAVIYISNLAISAANRMYGRYQLIDSNRLPTDTMKQVHGLKNSANAMISIRAREEQKLAAKPKTEDRQSEIHKK